MVDTLTCKNEIRIRLGARNLSSLDWFSKSDPYLVISKTSASGQLAVIRKSETKKNCHSPNWKEFIFCEHDINQQNLDLKMKFEIFDDDFCVGDDQKLGTSFLSPRQLEAAALMGTKLPLVDDKGNLRLSGNLVVTSFSSLQKQEWDDREQNNDYRDGTASKRINDDEHPT